MAREVVGTGGQAELERWLAPFLARLGHKARQRMCPLYVAGLIGPGERKSIQPMAERLGLRPERPVPSGPERARVALGGGHTPPPEGLSGGCRPDLSRCRPWPTAPAAYSRPRVDEHDRLRLPPDASALRREGGKNARQGRRLNQACLPSDAPSSSICSTHPNADVHTAAKASSLSLSLFCQSSARLRTH